MVDLTVGQVSGLIALAIAVLSLLFPNLIILLMVAVVGRESPAVTWSVIGRELGRTWWPVILGSDTAATAKVNLPLRLVSLMRTFAVLLVTVASVVTPLGLYSKIQLASSPTMARFVSVEDIGPMGYGTPPRNASSFVSRICANHANPATCPFSNTQIQTPFKNVAPDGIHSQPFDDYDIRIPYTTAQFFSSLHDEQPSSVAGIFDIEWRQYTYSQKPFYNGNQSFQVGYYRALSQLLLGDETQLVEGLVVDFKNGGVGFRGHTAPTDVPYGAEWEEDLLFVSPESACVNTNLTLEFQIAPIGTYSNYSSNNLVNVSLTDHGGFYNHNHTVPDESAFSGKGELDLWYRAYKGAWANNYYTMLYLNATDRNKVSSNEASHYIDSQEGKKFWLDPSKTDVATTESFGLTHVYGGYLDLTGQYSYNGTYTSYNYTSSYSDPRANYANPYHIAAKNFTQANVFCSNVDQSMLANSSNLAIACGLMYGAATRQDRKTSLVLESGTWWTQPIYSCATAMKVQMKTVRFQWNSTSADQGLERLKVVTIADKTYPQASDQPWWGIENLGHSLFDESPLWGPISSKTAEKWANSPNFTVTQAPHIYIPGLIADAGLAGGFAYEDNVAGNKAFAAALTDAYSVGTDSQYSGSQSAALLAKWQNLTRPSAEGKDLGHAPEIPNILFTDLIANAIMTTRSQLTTSKTLFNSQPQGQYSQTKRDLVARAEVDPGLDSIQLPSYAYQSRIAYHWPYAIPAFLTLAVLALVFILALVFAVLGRLPRPNTLNFYLKCTSAGRLLSVLMDRSMPGSASPYRELPHGAPNMPQYEGVSGDVSIRQHTKDWVRGLGRRPVNLDMTVASAGRPGGPAAGVYSPGPGPAMGTPTGAGMPMGMATSTAYQPSPFPFSNGGGGGYKAVPQVVLADPPSH